jgi:hypothetical protein
MTVVILDLDLDLDLESEQSERRVSGIHAVTGVKRVPAPC